MRDRGKAPFIPYLSGGGGEKKRKQFPSESQKRLEIFRGDGLGIEGEVFGWVFGDDVIAVFAYGKSASNNDSAS